MWFLIPSGVVMAIVSCTVVNKRSYWNVKCPVSAFTILMADQKEKAYLITSYVYRYSKPGKPQMKNSIHFVQNVWKISLLCWRNKLTFMFEIVLISVLTTRSPRASFFKRSRDQKLRYDLEWPNVPAGMILRIFARW